MKSFKSLLFVVGVLALMACARVKAADVSDTRTRPWIGITSTVDEGKVVCWSSYVEAVRQAGGLPVIVPAMEDSRFQADYLERLDGLVLIGGWDIPPAAYGETPHASTQEMPPVRWQWESRLIKTWLDSKKPLLGICLGAQMTNVVSGGTLIQDIPSQVGTTVIHRDEKPVWHRVTIQPGTRLHGLLGVGELSVTSSHHQAAERIGEGLVVSARSDDGVVEAMELPGDRWRLFLQWHPERMEPAHHTKIFGALVEACLETP